MRKILTFKLFENYFDKKFEHFEKTREYEYSKKIINSFLEEKYKKWNWKFGENKYINVENYGEVSCGYIGKFINNTLLHKKIYRNFLSSGETNFIEWFEENLENNFYPATNPTNIFKENIELIKNCSAIGEVGEILSKHRIKEYFISTYGRGKMTDPSNNQDIGGYDAIFIIGDRSINIQIKPFNFSKKLESGDFLEVESKGSKTLKSSINYLCLYDLYDNKILLAKYNMTVPNEKLTINCVESLTNGFKIKKECIKLEGDLYNILSEEGKKFNRIKKTAEKRLLLNDPDFVDSITIKNIYSI